MRARKPKPFKIPRNMPKPLTFAQTAKAYGLSKREVESIRKWLRLQSR